MRRSIATVFLAAALLCGYATAASAVSVGFDYVGYDSGSGLYGWNINILDINVGSSAINNTQVVQSYDFDVVFSNNTPVSAEFMGLLGDTTNDPAQGVNWFIPDSPSGGIIDIGEFSNLDASVLWGLQNFVNTTGVMTVATIFFATSTDPGLAFTNWEQGGVADLINNNAIKGPGDNNVLYDGPPVPEPGTILLIGAGLAALVPLRRKLIR